MGDECRKALLGCGVDPSSDMDFLPVSGYNVTVFYPGLLPIGSLQNLPIKNVGNAKSSKALAGGSSRVETSKIAVQCSSKHHLYKIHLQKSQLRKYWTLYRPKSTSAESKSVPISSSIVAIIVFQFSLSTYPTSSIFPIDCKYCTKHLPFNCS